MTMDHRAGCDSEVTPRERTTDRRKAPHHDRVDLVEWLLLGATPVYSVLLVAQIRDSGAPAE